MKDLDFEFYIRKVVHVLTYSILSLFILLNLPKIRFRFILSFVLTVIVSFLDESNQYITYGRSGRLWDVVLDSSAAFTTLFIVFVIVIVIKIRRKFQKSKIPKEPKNHYYNPKI